MKKGSEARLNKFENAMKKIILWIEIILAAFIMLTVIASGKDIVSLIYKLFITDAKESYEILQGILAHILLLVVGLELALMLITHSPSNVLEVILYAIARKMLISSTDAVEILLGVISLGIIFAVDKYLHTKDNKKTT